MGWLIFFPNAAMTRNGANHILNSCTFLNRTCPALKSLFRASRENVICVSCTPRKVVPKQKAAVVVDGGEILFVHIEENNSSGAGRGRRAEHRASAFSLTSSCPLFFLQVISDSGAG